MSVPLVVDTREGKPYSFPGVDTVKRKPLNEGDYTHEGFEQTYAVERKTLDDLATSLGADRTRFENEIRRANGYAERNDDDNPLPGTKPGYSLDEFVVVIEADKWEVEDWAGKGHCPNYYSKIYPNSVLATVEQWPDKYETLNFIWAGDREGGKQETLRLLDKWYLTYS